MLPVRVLYFGCTPLDELELYKIVFADIGIYGAESAASPGDWGMSRKGNHTEDRLLLRGVRVVLAGFGGVVAEPVAVVTRLAKLSKIASRIAAGVY